MNRSTDSKSSSDRCARTERFPGPEGPGFIRISEWSPGASAPGDIALFRYYLFMPDWAARLKKVEERCQTQDLQALVVSSSINLKYLTGFGGSAGVLVCSPAGHCLIT